jgi:hypothetical protein
MPVEIVKHRHHHRLNLQNPACFRSHRRRHKMNYRHHRRKRVKL